MTTNAKQKTLWGEWVEPLPNPAHDELAAWALEQADMGVVFYEPPLADDTGPYTPDQAVVATAMMHTEITELDIQLEHMAARYRHMRNLALWTWALLLALAGVPLAVWLAAVL